MRALQERICLLEAPRRYGGESGVSAVYARIPLSLPIFTAQKYKVITFRAKKIITFCTVALSLSQNHVQRKRISTNREE